MKQLFEKRLTPAHVRAFYDGIDDVRLVADEVWLDSDECIDVTLEIALRLKAFSYKSSLSVEEQVNDALTSGYEEVIA